MRKPYRSSAREYIRDWYQDIAFWHPRNPLGRRIRQWHRENPWSLFKTSFWVLIGLGILAAVLWIFLGWVLGEKWAWNLEQGGENTRYAVMRMVLFIGAGLVGVVGVIVAYRRQKGVEEGHFLEQLANSARQLGDQNPTVQAAGIYTLAGLADRSTQYRRQQCVDVLCAYIRLPYVPNKNSYHDGLGVAEKIVHTYTIQRNTSTEERIERTTTSRPHDRETRQTALRVIMQHLYEGASVSWSSLDFDFTGATFDYANFKGAHFKGRLTNFTGVNFAGKVTSFTGAHFAGKETYFRATRFTGSEIYFKECQFSGELINFERAHFEGNITDFTKSHFAGKKSIFTGARFTGETILFEDSDFTSTNVYLHGIQLPQDCYPFNQFNFDENANTH